MTKSYEGKTVVIFGASSGFGRSTAEQLASKGANIVVAARREDMLDELVSQFPGRAVAVPADVKDFAQVQNVLEVALSSFGKVDVWIQNSGVAVIGNFTEIPMEDHEGVIDTNLKGAIHGAYAALKYFESVRGGHLILTASAGGKIPFPFWASYIATKFGIVGFAKTMHQELEHRKLNDVIHITTIDPFTTDTPFFEHAGNYSGRTIRMPLPSEQQDVVDAMFNAIDNPTKHSIEVGGPAKMNVVMEKLLPKLGEKMGGAYVGKTMEASPAYEAPSSGNIHAPLPGDKLVEGQMQERIKAEDAQKSG